MKLTIIILLFFFGINNIYAQKVVATAGDYYNYSNISISWTLGEPVIETISNGSNILTQGFQQSKLSASEIYTVDSKNININVFPNPAQEFVTIKTYGNKEMHFQLTDINGKSIKEENINSDNTNVSLKELPRGIFLLQISKNNKILKIFKLIKQ